MMGAIKFNPINPIKDVLFWGCFRMAEGKKGSLSKICHIYPIMMKTGKVISYLKMIQKIYMNHLINH